MASPPAKFLELGTDQLLIGYFRGGVGPSSVLPGKEKRKREEVPVKGDGRELPLFVGDGWLPVDGRSVSEQVLYPTPTAIDKVDFLSYVKQDG